MLVVFFPLQCFALMRRDSECFENNSKENSDSVKQKEVYGEKKLFLKQQNCLVEYS